VLRAALVAAAAVFTAACGDAPLRHVAIPPAPSDAWESSDCLYDGTFASVSTDPAWTCGYVSVPVRHAEPDGPSLRVPLAIHVAAGPLRDPDPLFVAQGGPGGDAFGVFASLAESSASAWSRDIVVFNQRGTLGSEPELTCPELWEADEELAEMSDDQASERELELLSDCRARLEDEGADLAAFNSSENARDIDAIREALGYDQINFYGVSYGSRLGLNLLRERPEHVRSVILDAVVPTHVNFLAEVAPNTQRLLAELADACDADPACLRAYDRRGEVTEGGPSATRGSGTALDERILALADRLDEEPVRISFDGPGGRFEETLDGAGLVDGIFQMAYLADAVAVVPHMVDRMEHGDFRILSALESFFASDQTDAEGMYLSVVCAEDGDLRVVDLPDGDLPERLTDIARQDARDMRDACAAWSVPSLPEASQPVVSDVPALLLSGRFDPITPPANGDEAAAYLSSSAHVIDPAGAHGVAFDGGCVDLIVASFLDRPDAEPDTRCLAERTTPAFVRPDAVFVPWMMIAIQPTVPAAVRLGLSVALLAAIAMAIAVWLVAFVVRKRRGASPVETDRELWSRWAGRTMAIAFLSLAVVFVAVMMVFALQSILSPLSIAFSLSGAARPAFVIPVALAGLAVLMAAVSGAAWLRSAWPLWERAVYAMVAAAALLYVVILALDGNLTALL
jgi:pimeloyl-ACP methyl ester carboxylesterase